jgi:hypothetical protein
MIHAEQVRPILFEIVPDAALFDEPTQLPHSLVQKLRRLLFRQRSKLHELLEKWCQRRHAVDIVPVGIDRPPNRRIFCSSRKNS